MPTTTAGDHTLGDNFTRVISASSPRDEHATGVLFRDQHSTRPDISDGRVLCFAALDAFGDTAYHPGDFIFDATLTGRPGCACDEHVADRIAVVNHGLCVPEDHDRSLPDPPGDADQAKASDGLIGCNDDGRPLFYCRRTENWHHVDPQAECFLCHAWGRPGQTAPAQWTTGFPQDDEPVAVAVLVVDYNALAEGDRAAYLAVAYDEAARDWLPPGSEVTEAVAAQRMQALAWSGDPAAWLGRIGRAGLAREVRPGVWTALAAPVPEGTAAEPVASDWIVEVEVAENYTIRVKVTAAGRDDARAEAETLVRESPIEALDAWPAV
jgi:hypothetical protein